MYNIACICIGPKFHIWEKTCSLWLSEPGKLHLRWHFPVPPIYLQTTKFHSSLWLYKIPLYINITFSKSIHQFWSILAISIAKLS
jgi:hypothetical protein